jgi:hypothetical protein
VICNNNNCVTSANWYWLLSGGIKMPLTSMDVSVVNLMTADGGYKCIGLFTYYGGIQYDDKACTDNTYINTVCEFEGSTLSPTSKFVCKKKVYMKMG